MKLKKRVDKSKKSGYNKMERKGENRLNGERKYGDRAYQV